MFALLWYEASRNRRTRGHSRGVRARGQCQLLSELGAPQVFRQWMNALHGPQLESDLISRPALLRANGTWPSVRACARAIKSSEFRKCRRLRARFQVDLGQSRTGTRTSFSSHRNITSDDQIRPQPPLPKGAFSSTY